MGRPLNVFVTMEEEKLSLPGVTTSRFEWVNLPQPFVQNNTSRIKSRELPRKNYFGIWGIYYQNVWGI